MQFIVFSHTHTLHALKKKKNAHRSEPIQYQSTNNIKELHTWYSITKQIIDLLHAMLWNFMESEIRNEEKNWFAK